MRRIAAIVLLFIVTVPPLIFFYLRAQDKELAGVLLVVFAGFFVDRCIDSWDRRDLSIKVRGITDTIEETIGRVTVEAGVAVVWRVPLATSFAYATNRLKGAARMLNTALSARGHGAISQDWINAIADAVAQHGCFVHEVAASHERAHAVKNALGRYREQLAGSYLVRDISGLFAIHPNLPFTEFIVFDYRNGTKEVIFGWSTSSETPANQDCFATADPAIAAFFETQFHRLAQLGHDTQEKSAGS